MIFGLRTAKMMGQLLVQFVSKIFNLCGPDPPTSQTDRQTDGQTTCDLKTALCTIEHHAVKCKLCKWETYEAFSSNSCLSDNSCFSVSFSTCSLMYCTQTSCLYCLFQINDWIADVYMKSMSDECFFLLCSVLYKITTTTNAASV